MTNQSSTGAARGALTGLRVLDLTQALAGPFCTQILADHGADVIKVEPPVSGDMARSSGPFHREDTARQQSAYFHSINRNKKSIVVDLKAAAGREILLRLLPGFDVLVENFRTGVMDRLGLSYELLQARHPRLVYATIRGFGDPRTGASPYAQWPAFDTIAQAMGGLAGITGPDVRHPTKVGPGVGDTVPALYLTIGILAAVLHARTSGRGQFVDVAMVDAVLAVSERIVYQHSFEKVVAEPQGNHHPFLVPFGFFPASDGHVAIACTNDVFFAELCNRLGAPMLGDSQFATAEGRVRNRQRVIEALSVQTQKFTKRELAERLGGHIPFGPIYNMADIANDPHFAVRGMLAEIECPGVSERLNIAGVPIKLSQTPGAVVRRGPIQGEHTQEILADAGCSPQEIKAWRDAGVIR